MRFRAAQHLRRQSDIRAVREQGRRLDGGVFTLWWRPRPPDLTPQVAVPRVCVVASTAAVGGAVARNRAKRRMREVFRHHQTEIAAGCDLMLVARSGLNRVTYTELEQRFVQVVRKIRPPTGATLPGGAPPSGSLGISRTAGSPPSPAASEAPAPRPEGTTS